MRDFHNLDAWHKAHNLTLNIYKLTEQFPKSENFGLVLSLRRSSAVVAMKIAEACGREDGEPYASGLRHARGLGMELEYLMLLSLDLKMIDKTMHDSLQSQIIEVRRMLSGVIKRHSTVAI
jgi:four helix bundle protein